MVGLLKVLRSAIGSLLIFVLLASSLGPHLANATLPLSAFFWPICIRVSVLSEDLHLETRNDLAELVSNAVRVKVEALDRGRKVWTEPNCIKADQPGADRQLTLELSVKRRKVTLEGREWNVLVASGVSTNGLIQDRWVQPVIIIQQALVSDDSIVGALVEFVDRTVLATLKRQ